jgi:hypothetical protein
MSSEKELLDQIEELKKKLPNIEKIEHNITAFLGKLRYR